MTNTGRKPDIDMQWKYKDSTVLYNMIGHTEKCYLSHVLVPEAETYSKTGMSRRDYLEFLRVIRKPLGSLDVLASLEPPF